jgi:hypothetical protein
MIKNDVAIVVVEFAEAQPPHSYCFSFVGCTSWTRRRLVNDGWELTLALPREGWSERIEALDRWSLAHQLRQRRRERVRVLLGGLHEHVGEATPVCQKLLSGFRIGQRLRGPTAHGDRDSLI